MSRVFYAVNRETGERWLPNPHEEKQYLVMYDSGYLAVVTFVPWENNYLAPLDPKIWRIEHNDKK